MGKSKNHAGAWPPMFGQAAPSAAVGGMIGVPAGCGAAPHESSRRARSRTRAVRALRPTPIGGAHLYARGEFS